MVTHYPYSLKVNRLRIPLYLGVPDEERAMIQYVEMSLWLHFEQSMAAWDEDDAGFIDYDLLSKIALKVADERPYKLIENLALNIHKAIRAHVDQAMAEQPFVPVSITIHKPNLPVAYVSRGTKFTYSDLPKGAEVMGLYET